MPIERRSLFRPEVLAPYLSAFALPAEVEVARSALRRWADLLASGRAERFTEQELLPDFLTDVFVQLLGYAGPTAGSGRYTLSREKRVEVDGKFADAVLGEFGGATPTVVVAVEGKGPKDPLDRPFAGRRMSAVDQAYRYAINLRCDWLVVTNLREIRLYHKGSDQRTYEIFAVERLANDDTALRRLVFLLGADRVVRLGGRCHLEDLLAASEHSEKVLTQTFYAEHAEMRKDILHRLRAANPAILPESLLLYAQRLLDRALFCAFAEDRGLLPAETLKKAVDHRDPYNPRATWETFKGLFRAIDEGNEGLRIPAYNGGLFARDPGLDGLSVSDEVFAHFRRLGEYSFRVLPEAGEIGESEHRLIDVEILGHIFEQSISDLELIQRELAGEFQQASERGVSRRKREGAFYTPEFITRFLVGHSLSGVLAERFAALRAEQARNATGTAVRALEDPRVYDLTALKQPQRTALILFWDGWQGELESIRILDPACGSGAFLIEAFDQLHRAYDEATERLAELRGRGMEGLHDPDRAILQENLYGVDLNEAAIEICRLSIWIKTARRGKRLTDLQHNLRAGNSLVADPEVDPRSFFDWRREFPEVFRTGGFDVVVGNPPYVRHELLGSLKPHLEASFTSFQGTADLYVYFFERGLELLRPGGRLAFVVTNKWLKAGYAEKLRALLGERASVETVVDLGHAKRIFPDADVSPSIVVVRKPDGAPRAPTVRVCRIPDLLTYPS